MNVSSISVSEGQTIDLSGEIIIQFDQIINVSTVNENTVFILDEYGAKVNVVYEIPDITTVKLIYTNLIPSTQYTLYIKRDTISQDGVKSILEDSLPSDYTLSFVTREAVETDLVIDYDSQEVDISDKPIKIYSSNNGVVWDTKQFIKDNVLVLHFDNSSTLTNFADILVIEIEDLYLNPVPIYVFYQVIDNKVLINITQQDGNKLPNNCILSITLDNVTSGSELLLITKIHPQLISRLTLKQNLGNLSNNISEFTFTLLYIESLVYLENLYKKPMLEMYTGLVDELKLPELISNQSYIKVNELYKSNKKSTVTVNKNSMVYEVFKNIMLYKVLEYIVINTSNYDTIDMENIRVTYNTKTLKDMLDSYKQKLDELILNSTPVLPAVANRLIFDGLNRNKIKTYSRLYSKLNIYRDGLKW